MQVHQEYAIWMIDGQQPELRSVARDREQIHALRASRRQQQVSLIERIRGITRPKAAETDLVCCPA